MPLWKPKNPEKTKLYAFMQHNGYENIDDLYAWSINDLSGFWKSVYDFCGIVGDFGGAVFEEGAHFDEAKWFAGTKLNFAENLLRNQSDDIALIFKSEDRVSQNLSFKEIYDMVSKLQQFFIEKGLQKGDRVAALLPNCPETVITMLAATSLGAIFTACSPDFGTPAILDRFTQVEPKILVACADYVYGGKNFSCLDKIEDLKKNLPSLQETILTPFEDIFERFEAKPIVFERFDFNHPLYIVYSSGTTGVPKCIVHRAGGVLLQHMKEHQLHGDIHEGDKVFYFTTCGWMMWHWLISALASRAALVLYDGNPFYTSPMALWEMAEKEGITHFGTSAKYIDALAKAHVKPCNHYPLEKMRVLFSTGSPLAPENFDYVYESIKKDVCLASIAGGTDLLSCFMLSCPIKPVYRGEIQMRGLGMAVDVFNEQGQSVKNQKGELVCTKPFPSQPLGFWNDSSKTLYRHAYFERFQNVWHHGDFIELTKHGGIIVYGRSDATLNPGGVRIGTAEIYRLVEHFDAILESLAVGRPNDKDEDIVLFVRMREGKKLDDDLIEKLKKYIRQKASPRHVPRFIIEAPDFPRTKNGKLAEIAVKRALMGEHTTNAEALLNPEALRFFKELRI